PTGQLHRRVVEVMTTNETTFFRDAVPFDALRTTILPELALRRAAERRLHFWSAASASGQEAYSLLMLLGEHFPQLGSWQLRVIASDLSQAMLARTQAGRYTH